MSHQQQAPPVIQQPYGYTNTQMVGAGPAGLEYLASVDQLIVKQQLELAEILTGIETQNRYRVLNNQEQQVFFVGEESGFFMRNCCGPNRGFIFHFTSGNTNQEVMRMERQFRCCVGCPWCADGCCKYPIDVMDASGRKIGMVRMKNFCFAPVFGIFDENDSPLFEVSGDCCRIQGPCCTDDINFPVIQSGEGTKVANIAKQWSGALRECVADADTYCVTFPMDMPIAHKALLLAGVFLVDMTLYERKQKQ